MLAFPYNELSSSKYPQIFGTLLCILNLFTATTTTTTVSLVSSARLNTDKYLTLKTLRFRLIFMDDIDMVVPKERKKQNPDTNY